MLSAGIDIGAQNLKVVILDDNDLLSYRVVPSGWDTENALGRAFRDVLEESGVSEESLKHIGATGMSRETVSFATSFTIDSTSGAKGVTWVIPSARTVIDIGAEQSRVFSCDQTGKVLDRVRNDQCAAGAGAFLEEISARLDLELEEMGKLSLSSNKNITINSTCVIFAESEVVSLINEGVNKEDISRSIVEAVADKAVSLLRSIKALDDIVFIGGVAMNQGVVDSVRKQIGKEILVPPEPRIVSAIGAALVARDMS